MSKISLLKCTMLRFFVLRASTSSASKSESEAQQADFKLVGLDAELVEVVEMSKFISGHLLRGSFYFILSFYRNIPMGCLTLISIDSFTERKSLWDYELHAVGINFR